MTRRNFYTLALWLPLTWPVIISLGEAFLHTFTWHQMSQLSGLIILSGLCGGTQYLLFAAALSFSFSTRDIEYINRAIWFLPLIFAAICSVGLWCFFTFMSMHASHLQVRTIEVDPINVYNLTSNVAFFALAVGYGYLAVLQIFIYLLSKYEFFQD